MTPTNAGKENRPATLRHRPDAAVDATILTRSATPAMHLYPTTV